MIKVCLVGADIAKEKTLLESQTDIKLTTIAEGDIDAVLAEITEAKPNILVISDVTNGISADELCLSTHLRSPVTKTLIITEEEADFERLQQSGFTCRGYILYGQRHAIVRAVRVVNDGESWLSRKLITAVLDHLAANVVEQTTKPQLIKNS